MLSPTRELATQTEQNIRAIGDHMAVQVRADWLGRALLPGDKPAM